MNLVGMPSVARSGVLAEGGHLDHAGRLGAQHGNHPEGGPDGQGPPVSEKVANLWGGGGRGHVIILGHAAGQFVADTSPRPVGFKARMA